MDPDTVNLITGHGLPLLIASAVCVAIKLFRVPLVQNFLARLSAKLVWENWPKPLCSLVVILASAAAAFIASAQQGTPVKRAIIDALMGAFLAMGLDSQHDALVNRASTNKADSIAVPLPDVKTPVLVALLALGLLSQGCGQFQAHARQPAAGPMVAPQAIAVIQPSDAQCQAWLNTTEGLTIAQEILTACAGGTGISAAFPDTNAGREALGITSVVCGLLDLGAHVWMNLDNVKLDTYCQIQPATVTP